MESKVLLTPVDDMVEIVKQNPNCEIEFIAKKLNLPQELIEKWLVVLEQFKILVITYKGFKGFVNTSDSLKKHDSSKDIDIDKIKQVFISKSKEKGLSIDKMQQAWPTFLQRYETDIKDLFTQKAKTAGYEDGKIVLAWNKFRIELNTL
ncbi:MAG: hypothetical protein HRU03_08885 [Nanoarchaeales archaeon]|nr:hypothetical protein [Nanoarchaeales archaeon]